VAISATPHASVERAANQSPRGVDPVTRSGADVINRGERGEVLPRNERSQPNSRRCAGQGRLERTRRLAVRVPAGVDTGSQIRLSGEGGAGLRGGPPGDLYVALRVKAHPHLARHDQDVIFELRVNIVQASLGDRIEIPTLDGSVEIAIPAGTQNGQSFRLAGKGMPDVRGGRRGDQYVVVQIVVPKDLTAEQKALLRKVGGLTGKPEKVSKGFFEKLRDAISLD